MKEKVTNIIVNLQLEGFHNWPQAKEIFPQMAFLSERHRHIFHFKLVKRVNHDDRDIEIIYFKREVIEYLLNKYGIKGDFINRQTCEFENRSCEMLADELLNQFECEYVSVLEDNENGAEVVIQ